jgi:hypothetical protein
VKRDLVWLLAKVCDVSEKEVLGDETREEANADLQAMLDAKSKTNAQKKLS